MTHALPLAPDTDWDLELFTLLDAADGLCRHCSKQATRRLHLCHSTIFPDCAEHPVDLCDAHADELWGKARRKMEQGPGFCNICRGMIGDVTHYITADLPL